MSGFLRTVGQVASAVALVASVIPGGQIFGLAAKTISLVATGVAIASNVGAALTAKKPFNERQGQQTQFKIDPGGPIPIVLGRTGVGGTIVHRTTYGTDNHYKTYMVSLSFGLRNPVESFSADLVNVPFSGTGVTGYYANWMWLDRRNGGSPQTALGSGVVSPPFGTAGPVPNWGSAYKLNGHTSSSMTLLFDTKARRYASGEPSPLWIVGDPIVYDPRYDSTVPGGSGPQRWADPSDRAAHLAARATWAPCNTPAIIGLNWRLGIWLCDESDPAAQYQRVAGIGAPIDLIDIVRIMEAATVQEAAGFKLGGQVDTSMEKWTVLKMIDEAGAAESVMNGATLSIFQQMPRTPLATITRDDLANGALTAPGMVSRTVKLNGYRARFLSEPHGWQMTDINIVQVPEYVAEDGRSKTEGGDFNLVPDADQCACLAAYKVFDSRELTRTLPLKPLWSGWRIGDCLAVDMPEIGLVETTVVRGRQNSPASAIVTLTLRTESSGKHAAALGQTATVPPTPALSTISDEVAAPDAADWSASGATLTANGASIPAIVATRTTGAIGNTNSDAIVFDYRAHVDGQSDADGWLGASFEAPDVTRKEFGTVTPGTQYDIGVRYRVRGAVGERLILGPVTTGALATANETSTAIRAANILCSTDLLVGSDDGGSGKITVAPHTWDYGQLGHCDRAAGTITGLTLGTRYYVYFDDGTLADASPTYAATTVMATSYNSSTNPYRHYLGYVDVPAAGGGSTPGGGGGSGGCPAPDMYLLTQDRGNVAAGEIAVGDLVWSCHELTDVWGWYRVSAVTEIDAEVYDAAIQGDIYRTSGSHLFRRGAAWRQMASLPGAKAIGSGKVIVIEVEDAHTYMLLPTADAAIGVLSHNKVAEPDD